MDKELNIPSFVNEGERANNAAKYVKNYEKKKLKKAEFYKSLKKTIGVIAITGGAVVLVTQTPVKKPISVLIDKIVEYDNAQFEKDFEITKEEVKRMTDKSISQNSASVEKKEVSIVKGKEESLEMNTESKDINDAEKIVVAGKDGDIAIEKKEDYKNGVQTGYYAGISNIDYSVQGREDYKLGYEAGYEMGKKDREIYVDQPLKERAEKEVETKNPNIAGSIKEQYVNLQKALIDNNVTIDNSKTNLEPNLEFISKTAESDQLQENIVASEKNTNNENKTYVITADGNKYEGSAEEYTEKFKEGYSNGNNGIDIKEDFDVAYEAGYEMGKKDRETYVDQIAKKEVEDRNPNISGVIKEQYVNLKKSLLENNITVDNSLEDAKTR